eukprot:scaffold294_cov221-Amphora_coffeaeformis.AAC.21
MMRCLIQTNKEESGRKKAAATFMIDGWGDTLCACFGVRRVLTNGTSNRHQRSKQKVLVMIYSSAKTEEKGLKSMQQRVDSIFVYLQEYPSIVNVV